MTRTWNRVFRIGGTPEVETSTCGIADMVAEGQTMSVIGTGVPIRVE